MEGYRPPTVEELLANPLSPDEAAQLAAYIREHGGLPGQGQAQGGGLAQGVGQIAAPLAQAGGQYLGSQLVSEIAGAGGAVPGAPEVVSAGWSSASGAGASAPSVAAGSAPGVPQVVNGLPVSGGGPLGALAVPLGAAGVAAYYGPAAYSAADDMFSGDTARETSGAVRAAALSNPITAWAVPITDALGIDLSFGAGKHEDQLARDSMRSHLEEQGLASVNEQGSHQVELADGSFFDIGRDGGEPYYNVGYGTSGYVDGTEEAPGDVSQYITENYGDTVGLLDPLMGYYSGFDDKLNRDFTGYYTNAAHSSGDPRANIDAMYDRSGLDRDTLYGAVVEAHGQGKLSDERADAFRAAIDRYFGVVNPNQGKGGEAEGFFTKQEPF